MGYRSDVAVVFEVKDTDKLLKAAKDWDKKYNLDGSFTVESLIDEADKNVTTKDKKYHLLAWYNIKWYAKLSKEKIYLSQEFFETDHGIKYDFARIGEEMGDYEVKGDLNSGIVIPSQCLWFDEEFE